MARTLITYVIIKDPALHNLQQQFISFSTLLHRYILIVSTPPQSRAPPKNPYAKEPHFFATPFFFNNIHLIYSEIYILEIHRQIYPTPILYRICVENILIHTVTKTKTSTHTDVRLLFSILFVCAVYPAVK